MIKLPEKCLRNKPYCQPIAQLQSDGPCKTFICVGLNEPFVRKVEDDYLTKCVTGTDGVDNIDNCDDRDLTDEMSVIAQALSVIANMRENEKK
jgi:hypothetical protein